MSLSKAALNMAEALRPVLVKLIPQKMLSAVKAKVIEKGAKDLEKTEITPFEPQAHKKGINLIGSIKSDTGLGQSMRLIGKRAQELYAEYDLNRAQSGILFALHQEDSMSQKELAKRLNVTPPSITSMIKKMEQEGYITRKADEQDQRVMRLTLAQKGRDSIAYVIKTAEKLEEKVFEGMSAEEKMLFRRLLLQIIENVE